MPHKSETFTWNSVVQTTELDIQKIVNNSVYMQYLDTTRIKHLQALGVDWVEWHNRGFNLVLAHADITYKAPLIDKDQFTVTSKIFRIGKIKTIFHQDIYRTSNMKHILSAINTVACVDIASGKPVMPRELEEKIFQQHLL